MRNKWILLATMLIIPLVVVTFLGVNGFAQGANPGGNQDPLVTKSYADGLVAWQVAELRAGQTIDCSAGTELIVRAGTAKIVAPTAQVGIPNVTAGNDLVAGTLVPHNHHLIIPRTDGRGIAAQNDIIVMYRGKVTIK